MAEVEQLYGEPVRIETVNNLKTTRKIYAEATVTPNGNPVVSVDPIVQSDQTELIHELLHLKLWKFGFPDKVLFLPIDGNRILLSAVDVWTVSVHSVIYREMRKIGLDPTSRDREELDELIKGGVDPAEWLPSPVRSAAAKRAIRAFVYMRIYVECDDQSSLSKLDKWFERRGWNEEIRVGRTAGKVMMQMDKGPNGRLDATIKALNILHDGRTLFFVESFVPDIRGKFVNRKPKIVPRT
ncbi:MAG TPA: hypothetical protein VGK99_11390 [Acidobacteriota bacterium]|jgi:hypothetical protein